MIKCSYCEQPLVCKSCHQPFRPRRDESHQGVYQPEMHVPCPECQKVLTCRSCGFVYGEEEEEGPK